MIPSGGSAPSVLWGMHAAQSRLRMVEAQLAACTQRAAETPGQARTAVCPVCQPECGAKTAGSSASAVKILISQVRANTDDESHSTDGDSSPRQSTRGRRSMAPDRHAEDVR